MSIINEVKKAILQLGTLDEKVELINRIREAIHEVSPFEQEPVDMVYRVKSDEVVANDYNPNSVAPPEMELLRLSIEQDGFTQPIVSFPELWRYTVVDGFHRNRVWRECEDVKNKIHWYLPIVKIKKDRENKWDRIASTVRHNRARGKHSVDGMAEIILDLRRRNRSNEKIGKNLGMDPDEVLRLSQITWLAEMFAENEFSEAWEAQNLEDDLKYFTQNDEEDTTSL